MNNYITEEEPIKLIFYPNFFKIGFTLKRSDLEKKQSGKNILVMHSWKKELDVKEEDPYFSLIKTKHLASEKWIEFIVENKEIAKKIISQTPKKEDENVTAQRIPIFNYHKELLDPEKRIDFIKQFGWNSYVNDRGPEKIAPRELNANMYCGSITSLATSTIVRQTREKCLLSWRLFFMFCASI